MKTYDAVFIFQAEEEKYRAGAEIVKNAFKNNNISIRNESDLGIKVLAYEIKKQNQGHYVKYDIEGSPESVFKMDKAFHLNPEVLKYLFVKKEK